MTDTEPIQSAGRPRRRLWWLIPAVLVVLWLVVAGPLGSFLGKLGDVQKNDNAAFLPTSAESTTVQTIATRFGQRDLLPAIVVYRSPDRLTGPQLAAIRADARDLEGRLALRGPIVMPPESRDRHAAQLVVPIDATSDVGAAVDEMRARVTGHPGLTAHVAGPAGLTADLVKSFAGIDGTLLLVTGTLVFLILIVVYRSPLLPILVLLTAILALAVAAAIIYQLADHDVIDLNGQSQGILFILVIGACTDYSLLLVSRYREELRVHGHRLAAMRAAYRAAVAPIVASGGTVILGVLCLLFTDLKSTRGLGPVAAIGIGASLLAALTFLPAVLVLFGRAAFWPARPRRGSAEHTRRGLWGRVADLVGRRPRALWITITVVLLVVGAAFLPQFKASGTKQTDVFLKSEDSAVGQQVIADHFPAGAGNPVQIVTDAGAAGRVVAATRGVRGVVPSSVAPVTTTGQPGHGAILVVDGRVLVEATLTAAPDSASAIDTVGALRDRVHAVRGAHALVGGYTATQADTQTTSERDRTVVIPIVLVVILLILMLLLRAVVAPVLLVASVVLSFAATLGVAALVFNHVFHFPGTDAAVPLFAFVFLVALGVDYNIFLMSRVREESLRVGTRRGALRGLRATGGVITSAGVVLAATFASLAVLPLLFLAEIAFLVAFGVLLDTLVVRSLLVPALVVDLGRHTWWPSRLSRRAPTEPAAPADAEPAGG